MSSSISTDSAVAGAATGSPSATASTDAPVLSIADIQNAIRVIDYAADQGAFKGWGTIEQVLAVRNRMNDFLKAVAPAAEAAAGDAMVAGPATGGGFGDVASSQMDAVAA